MSTSESDCLINENVITSSSDEDVLELLNIQERRKKTKNENYFDQIDAYDEQEFFEHFRVSREIANNIAEKFKVSQYYFHQLGEFGKLSTYQYVIIFLWFCGHEAASFRDISDRFDISLSSLRKIIQRMTYFLSNLSCEIIQWPNNEEKVRIERHFRQNGFPYVIGCIDGTHIKIDKPSEDPDSYLNRKHFYSIQLQVVCDHENKILDVFVGFPGSVHDSRVFRASPLSDTLEEKCQDFVLLGDSGYPCLRNLLTPFKDRGNLTQKQVRYNLKLSKNRYKIEHTFGILKQKFRQLYHLKLRNIDEIVNFIRACCVLHNIALTDNFNLLEEVREEENVRLNIERDEEDNRDGINRRNEIANILT